MKAEEIIDDVWRVIDYEEFCNIESDKFGIVCSDTTDDLAKVISSVPDMLAILIETYHCLKPTVDVFEKHTRNGEYEVFMDVKRLLDRLGIDL